MTAHNPIVVNLQTVKIPIYKLQATTKTVDDQDSMSSND